MARKSAKVGRKLRGAQKWIVGELRSLGPSETLSTSKIAKRISKLSGKRFHKNSVYNALRILVGRGDIKVVRSGREKSYQVASTSSTVAAPSVAAPRAASPVAQPKSPAPARSEPVVVESYPIPSALPHKLALGEILVLEIGDGFVMIATNLHGRLVVERQSVPAK
jgi:hypothetical protein